MLTTVTQRVTARASGKPVAVRPGLSNAVTMTTAMPRVRVLGDSDFEAFHHVTTSAFLATLSEDAVAQDRVLFGRGRFHGAFDGDEMIGGGIVSKKDGNAGGRYARGVLTSLMRAQLEGLHAEAVEPNAVLWCSEASIYGRFGCGRAPMRSFTSVPRATTFASTVDCGGGARDAVVVRRAFRCRHRVDAHEIVSVDPVTQAAIWRYLLDIDLGAVFLGGTAPPGPGRGRGRADQRAAAGRAGHARADFLHRAPAALRGVVLSGNLGGGFGR